MTYFYNQLLKSVENVEKSLECVFYIPGNIKEYYIIINKKIYKDNGDKMGNLVHEQTYGQKVKVKINYDINIIK